MLISNIFWVFACKVWKMFVYKHAKTVEYVKKFYFLRKIKTLWINNSRILWIKNAKFSGYYFSVN